MTSFYICRHGQTLNNKEHKLSGWVDTPLTDEGIANAKSSAAKLQNIHFDLIISSDLGRAFITAYIISIIINYSYEIATAKELREVSYGDLGNRPISDYPVVSRLDNANLIHPNGESLVQMQNRVLSYLQTLSVEYPNNTVLIVAHDGTINTIRASYENENIGIVHAKYSNPHDFVAKFSYTNSKITSFEEVLQ